MNRVPLKGSLKLLTQFREPPTGTFCPERNKALGVEKESHQQGSPAVNTGAGIESTPHGSSVLREDGAPGANSQQGPPAFGTESWENDTDVNITQKTKLFPELSIPTGRKRKLSTTVFNNPKLRAILENVGNLQLQHEVSVAPGLITGIVLLERRDTDTNRNDVVNPGNRQIHTPRSRSSSRLPIKSPDMSTPAGIDDVRGIVPLQIPETQNHVREQIPRGGKMVGVIDRFRGFVCMQTIGRMQY